MPLPPLPIDAVLPELLAALAAGSRAVLVAPPGAGKTTRVPLALLDAPWRAPRLAERPGSGSIGPERDRGGRVILLEPRRLAARAAARFMAKSRGEDVGQTVGYRVRLESRVSKATRIEVVTEGVFTRMLLDDPELAGVAAVLFDEFHERSLDADLGLALALDASALRPDLRLLVMSATIDGARVASLLGDAPVIESEGRAFPVETRYLGRNPAQRFEEAMAAAVLQALGEEAGSVLAFLPGQGEIHRIAQRLAERLRDPAVDVVPLYGALDKAVQDRVVSDQADREAIRTLLQREEVREVAGKAGLSLDKAVAAAATLQGDDLRQIAEQARQVDNQLAGGASNIVISTTTIIIVLLLVILIVASISFFGIGMMTAVLPLISPEKGAQLGFVAQGMLLVVSGVYYPVEVLPQWMQWLAKISPATYELEGIRAAILDGASLGSLWHDIWPLLIIGAVCIPLGLWIFNRGEVYAKRHGKLKRSG